ncbi:hypothetical protein Dcar01_03533 [Deinococcus carri]|uniref:Uncharacterized protein n=1 Tax=Deinococcus carri TaxID=1211323 RepID=A0ABP9WBS1_9DEIO
MKKSELDRRSRALAMGLVSELQTPGLDHVDITMIRAWYARAFAALQEEAREGTPAQEDGCIYVVGGPRAQWAVPNAAPLRNTEFSQTTRIEVNAPRCGCAALLEALRENTAAIRTCTEACQTPRR